MRKQAVAIASESIRDSRTTAGSVSNDNLRSGGPNSPQAVFGEMLRVTTMIVGVAFAVAFLLNAIHLG